MRHDKPPPVGVAHFVALVKLRVTARDTFRVPLPLTVATAMLSLWVTHFDSAGRRQEAKSICNLCVCVCETLSTKVPAGLWGGGCLKPAVILGDGEEGLDQGQSSEFEKEGREGGHVGWR